MMYSYFTKATFWTDCRFSFLPGEWEKLKIERLLITSLILKEIVDGNG